MGVFTQPILSTRWWLYTVVHSTALLTLFIKVKSVEYWGVSFHWLLHFLFNNLCRLITKKKSNICITGLLWGNPLVTSGFPSQRACNAEIMNTNLMSIILSGPWSRYHHSNICSDCLSTFCFHWPNSSYHIYISQTIDFKELKLL